MSDPSLNPEAEGQGLARRGLLKCMAWAGTGMVWSFSGGVAASSLLGAGPAVAAPAAGLSFVQISDSHIGFRKPANPDPMATLRETISKIKALPVRPDFVLHTGDITHLATPDQFDTAYQAISEIGLPIHFVPGEHDIVGGTDPGPYRDKFAPQSKGNGWYSFDAGGAHFIALVNVVTLGDRGMGTLGADQLAWLKDDVSGLSASTPIVVFSHFPMWALFPDWGWGTADSAEALNTLSRFGSVTVLNGHIHQVQQKVEGKVTFHTARSTAYPQPAPGEGAGPGPLVVPPEQLHGVIGLTEVRVQPGSGPLAIVDQSLA
ncbi:metallophosphoesterase family protein [Phenylobacterium montanum]|uniref:Metallophosphoesterase n=1 Tax=Phenylobacterium montanum TaxID=2823693 RepID=A0A975FX67_9CAUL|nr:metallophosphoesterase [Caulobacter sp. S6]QUD87065.1 metallophosphoesterase [Caulobacter sp. S6]